MGQKYIMGNKERLIRYASKANLSYTTLNYLLWFQKKKKKKKFPLHMCLSFYL